MTDVPWRLVTDPALLESAESLAGRDVALAEKMILRILAAPYRAETIGSTKVRAIRAVMTGTGRALRLFYTADDGVVTLLRLEGDDGQE